MSIDTRHTALDHAIKVAINTGWNDAEHVTKVAKTFDDFLTGQDRPTTVEAAVERNDIARLENLATEIAWAANKHGSTMLGESDAQAVLNRVRELRNRMESR